MNIKVRLSYTFGYNQAITLNKEIILQFLRYFLSAKLSVLTYDHTKIHMYTMIDYCKIQPVEREPQ